MPDYCYECGQAIPEPPFGELEWCWWEGIFPTRHAVSMAEFGRIMMENYVYDPSTPILTTMMLRRTLDQDQPTRHSAGDTDRQGVTALPDPHGAPAVVYRSLDCNPPEDQLIPPTDSEV